MEKLKKLIDLCEGEIELQINSHKTNGETIEEYLKDTYEYGTKELSEGFIQEIAKKGVVYEIRFYPYDVHHFYCFYHYDIDKLLNKAIDTSNGN